MRTGARLRFGAGLFLAVSVLFLGNGPLDARSVAPAEARLAAARLLEMENGRPDLRLTKDVFLLDGIEPLIHRDRPVAYLARLKPQGFMILADVTEVTPQVFVSFSGDFDAVRAHPFLGRVLDRLRYDKVRLFYAERRSRPDDLSGPVDTPDPVQIVLNEQNWSALVDGPVPSVRQDMGPAAPEAVAPMLVSRWSQGSPYNAYTPRIDGEETPTGCSATAMAQVMYFWRYPDRGRGSHSYEWGGRVLSADFDHPYYWDRMLDSYASRYSDGQAEAVARLMSDVGIAIDMDYGVDGSGAFPNDNNAFFEFFKYSQDVRSIDRSAVASWTAWFNILKDQMVLRQPAVLAIYTEDSGHAVVADGYRTSPSNQVHVNMGWGGYADNYYSLANIYGYGDAEQDWAVIDIRPPVLATLRLSAGSGGTTDPAPGTYYYEKGADVRVTARPAQAYSFTGWSGDARGAANPLTVRLDRDKRVTARFRPVNPPSDLTAVRLTNRSVTQTEHIVDLAWDPNPANEGLAIASYRVYRQTGAIWVRLADVGGNATSYRHRMAPKEPQVYAVSAVSSDGGESPSATITK